MHTVPQEIVDATSDMEKKRQEAINEVFYTERDFVRDMEYLRDVRLFPLRLLLSRSLAIRDSGGSFVRHGNDADPFLSPQSWIKPLRSSNIIPEARREDFVQQVFWNVLEIYAVNVRLSELLNKRQKQAHVVDHIGDIFLDMVPHFGPFVKYGAHQLYGKYEFEKEKGSNPAFAKFVDVRFSFPFFLFSSSPYSRFNSPLIGNRTPARVSQAGTERLPHQAYDPSRAVPSPPRSRPQADVRRQPGQGRDSEGRQARERVLDESQH